MNKKNVKNFIVAASILITALSVTGCDVFNKLTAASQTMSDEASDAVTLNLACQSVYSRIISSKITNDNFNCDGSKITWAADAGTAQSIRQASAEKVTIRDVQIYTGTDILYDDLYYCTETNRNKNISKGDIIYLENNSVQSYAAFINPLKDTTTLGELYSK